MALEDLPVTRELVLEAALGAQEVERVEVRRITMAANLALGAHVHNGPVLGSIVEGSVLFQVEDGEQRVLRPGDVFFEPAGVVITHFDALEEGVVFLGYFPLGTGQQAEITLI
jgi:quercetin dioxygenase-like cupin family protein